MAATFTAKIGLLGVNPYVRPPDHVLNDIFKAAGRDKSPVPVRGTVNGAPFQQSLVRYQGDWRLYINGAMAKKAGFRYSGSVTSIAGQQATIELAYDTHPITYPMVPELQQALDGDRRARSAYDRLTPGRQKEILRYLGSTKSDVARKRTISRVLQHLRGEESDALYALMHRKPKD